MPDRDDHPGLGEAAYGLDAAGQLGGDRDHPHGTVTGREQRVDRGGGGCGQQVAAVGAGVQGAEPRALEVDAREQPLGHERRELAHRACRAVGAVRHEAGRHGGRAAREVGRGHRRSGLGGALVVRRAATAVHVQVDEPRGERRGAEVEVRWARRRTRPRRDDAVAVHVDPPRRQVLRRGEDVLGGQEHQSTAPSPTVRACGRPGSSSAGPGSPARTDSSWAQTAVP